MVVGGVVDWDIVVVGVSDGGDGLLGLFFGICFIVSADSEKLEIVHV